MPATPIYALPYPAQSDPADIPTDLQELAERTEAVLAGLVPAYVKLDERILAAGAATIDFPGIPQTYRHLRLVWAVRGDNAGASQALYANFNGDATAVYDIQRVGGSDGAPFCTESIGTSVVELGVASCAGAAAGLAGIGQAEIPNYRGGFHKGVAAVCGWKTGHATNQTFAQTTHSQWRNVAAINRITLRMGAGNLVAPSAVSLYGLL